MLPNSPMPSSAVSFEQQTKWTNKPSRFNRMVDIQEEIAEIDARLLSIRSAENVNASLDTLSAASEDSAQQPMVRHMLAVELCQLAAAGDTVGVRALLNGGADPDSSDYDSRTALHLASSQGHLPVVRLLLDYGADPSLQDRDGKAAVRLADEGGHDDVVELFLARSAQPLGISGRPESSRPGSPFTPSHPDFSMMPKPMMGSLIVIMVGLPGRGKSYIARQIQRYFQWNGLQSRVFTHVSYREQLLISPNRLPEHISLEEELTVASVIAHDMTHFVVHADGVAVLDGTHGTPTRRMALLNEIKKTCLIRSSRVVFVEVTNDDESKILNNIQHQCKVESEVPSNCVDGYFTRIEQQRSGYQSLKSDSDKDLTYIHIKGENMFSLNNICGWMPSRLAYMLQNLSHSPSDIYLTRSGEYVDLVADRLGGNSRLTPRGHAYSMALYEYFKHELGEGPLTVMSSCALRCTETVELFEGQSKLRNGGSAKAERAEMHCRVCYLPTLDNINYGDCSGMLLADVRRTMPATILSMQSDPYHTAWPNGECLHQIFNSRLEPHIHDMQASSMPLLVVSHLHLLQGLYSYFVSEDDKFIAPQDAYTIDVPLECVVKIRLVGVNRVAEVIRLSNVVDRLCTASTEQCRKTQLHNCNIFKELMKN